MVGHPNTQKLEKSEKGMSLIIVVTAIMILGILGWTLANLLSSDFQMNARNLESEKALYLADAGIQEALMHLSLSNDTGFDNDTDWLNRTLGSGEYNVSRQVSGTDVNVTSRGYVPTQANYRAMRQIRIVAVPGGKALNAATGGELFDWNNTTSINIIGDVLAQHFEGNDTNNITDQFPSDFAIPPPPPPDYLRTKSSAPLPEINIGEFQQLAGCFDSPPNATNCHMGNYTFASKSKVSDGIQFVGGNATINTDANIKPHTSFIAVDNINITGNDNIDFKAHVNVSKNKSYPNLASWNGNITCLGTGSHTFDGLIYTQNGIIDINKIKGVALMGRRIYLRGTVALNCPGQSKYIDLDNGFNVPANTTVLLWQEE